MMRIAVSSTGPALDSSMDERFGRCRYFVMVDPDRTGLEAIENPYWDLGSGAGIQAARLLTERGASVVLTGRCGPNASDTLMAAHVKLVTGCSGTVRRALEQYSSGSVRPVAQDQPDSLARPPSAGRSRGLGRGRGRGMGDAAGRGRGRGMGRRE
jgi:predicted Fe-Mo cluster-binding NifX family protein